MDLKEKALQLHKDHQGKIELQGKVPVKSPEDLTLAYTPGVAQPCLAIKENPDAVYEYTSRGNWVAVVTNGTAVLGLGDIGAAAGLPVMEGKALLFKAFAGVDAFPICLDTKDPEEVIRAVQMMAPSFGGVNLEDIKAPECFEIEEKLKACCDIPVFHDDQHGTAVTVLAALTNALRIVGKKWEQLKVVMNGAGAAGIAVAKLILSMGVRDIILCDIDGVVYRGRKGNNASLEQIAAITNHANLTGTLHDAIQEADVFVGVSAPHTLTTEMVAKMNRDAIVFAMANPVPEITPDEAKAGGARIVGTGRSDYPNQINNVLAFPGIFRGALDVRAKQINEEMKQAAAKAIASVLTDEELNEENILPKAFDKRIAPAVAKAVAEAAISSGVARSNRYTPEEIYKRTVEMIGQ